MALRITPLRVAALAFAVAIAALLLAALGGFLIGRAAGQEIRDYEPVDTDRILAALSIVETATKGKARELMTRRDEPDRWGWTVGPSFEKGPGTIAVDAEELRRRQQFREVRDLLRDLLRERTGRRAPCATSPSR